MNKKISSVLFLLFFGCQTNKIDDPSTNTDILVKPSLSNNINNTERYCYAISCPKIDESKIKPQLKYPVDLAVTKDGKRVYVLNRRIAKVNSNKTDTYNYLSGCNSKLNKETSRQFIYEIKENKTIYILKVDNQYPFSCELSENIDIDKNDNLYVSKPIIDKENKYSEDPYIGHEIYRITPDSGMSKYTEMFIDEPLRKEDIYSSSNPRDIKGRILNNMDILNDNNDKVVFSLIKHNSEGDDSVAKINNQNNLEYLVKSFYRTGSADNLEFQYYNGYLYSGLLKVIVPISERIINQFPETEEKIYQDISFKYGNNTKIDTNGNIYIIQSSKNTIWKVIPNKEVIRFAGSGEAGYKDGKGEEAQFNYPTSVSFDDNGNLYVADMLNNAIRKITPDGQVSTFYKEVNI